MILEIGKSHLSESNQRLTDSPAPAGLYQLPSTVRYAHAQGAERLGMIKVGRRPCRKRTNDLLVIPLLPTLFQKDFKLIPLLETEEDLIIGQDNLMIALRGS